MDLSRFTTIHPPPVAVSLPARINKSRSSGILTERKDLAVKESNEISPGKEGDLASERNPALGISVSPTERHYPGVEEEEGSHFCTVLYDSRSYSCRVGLPHDVTQLAEGGCPRALSAPHWDSLDRTDNPLLVIIGQCKSTVAYIGKCKCSKFLADCSSRC